MSIVYFCNVYHKNQRNVGKYASPMDGVGYTVVRVDASHSQKVA